jgi:O-antigen/teichoic acid export membrane protein
MIAVKGSIRTSSKAKHGVALSVVAGVLNILVNIALFPLIVSTIGAAQYGIWLFILILGQFFFYSDLGIGSAIVYFASSARGGNRIFSFDQLISNGTAWATTILVPALPAFLVIAYHYADTHADGAGLNHEQVIALVVIGGVLVATMIIRPFESVLIGSGHLARNIANQVAGNALRTAGVVVFCLSDQGVVAIAAAEAAGLSLGPILAMIYVTRTRIAVVRIADMAIRNVVGLFRYSLKTFAVDVVSVGALSAGTIMVGLISGPAPAAYFALAMKVYNGAGQVITWATAPALPVFSQIWHADPARSKALVRDLLSTVATVSAVCILPIALSSPLWLPHWVGAEGVALGAGACTVIVLVALMSNAILEPAVLACDSFGRPGVAFLPQAVATGLFILLGIPLTQHYGIVGTAVSLAVALWVVQPVWLVILSRTLKMSFRSEILTCYRTPALVLLAGGTLAACADILDVFELGINEAVFTPVGFVLGAAVAVGATSVGRDSIHGSRRLLEMPM